MPDTEQTDGVLTLRERCHRCANAGEVAYFNNRDGHWDAEPCPVCQASEPSSASKDAVLVILQGLNNAR